LVFISAFTLIFAANREPSCNPETTPYKYLASIKIKATYATISNPKPRYEIRTGAGVFVVASRRFPSRALRRGMRYRPAGLMHAKVWPRTGLMRPISNCSGQNVGVQEMIDWLILAGIIAITAAISFFERSEDVNA